MTPIHAQLLHRRGWLLALVLALAACVCSSTAPVAVPLDVPVVSLDEYGISRDNALVLAYFEQDTLDPARWLYGGDGLVGDLFSGLARLGVDLRPVPDLAEDWEISDDGTVYTFHLRPDVTFHDGKPFTADDVVYSWERAASLALGSHTAATYLNDIVGVPEVLAGSADSISGLRVIDDHTLEVTIDAPRAYFLYKLTAPAAWIVDRETVDQIDTAPNGTGPFSLMRHDENEVYIVQRNPNYHLGPVALEYVVYRIYAGHAVRLYETGYIDTLTISKDLVPRAQDPADPLYGNVQVASSLCTDFLVFDVTQPPFEDPLVRRAFVMAVDKARYQEVALGGTGVLADALYPPGLPGYTAEVAPLPYDPEAAAQALRDSSYGGPDGLPEVVFTTVGFGGDVSGRDGLLIQMWQQALGVTVTVEGLDFDSFYDELYGGEHGQIVSSGWCADYPDPENFAELFHTASVQNYGRYSNPEVDAILEQARSKPDIDLRLRMYQQVQQMLLDEAAAIFLSHSEAYYIVTKPYLNGYISTPIGVPQHMNLSIEHGQ